MPTLAADLILMYSLNNVKQNEKTTSGSEFTWKSNIRLPDPYRLDSPSRFFLFGLMHKNIQNYSNMTYNYTVKMYARDVTTGDQDPMHPTSIQIDTSIFKKHII